MDPPVRPARLQAKGLYINYNCAVDIKIYKARVNKLLLEGDERGPRCKGDILVFEVKHGQRLTDDGLRQKTTMVLIIGDGPIYCRNMSFLDWRGIKPVIQVLRKEGRVRRSGKHYADSCERQAQEAQN